MYVLFCYFYVTMYLFFNSFITYFINKYYKIHEFYISVNITDNIINSVNIYFEKPGEREEHFLSHTEERILLRFYELQLRDFCRRFTPSMPRATIATALHYFKRFYLRNSVMDYHPKEILVTCVYLACKVIIFFFF